MGKADSSVIQIPLEVMLSQQGLRRECVIGAVGLADAYFRTEIVRGITTRLMEDNSARMRYYIDRARFRRRSFEFDDRLNESSVVDEVSRREQRREWTFQQVMETLSREQILLLGDIAWYGAIMLAPPTQEQQRQVGRWLREITSQQVEDLRQLREEHNALLHARANSELSIAAGPSGQDGQTEEDDDETESEEL